METVSCWNSTQSIDQEEQQKTKKKKKTTKKKTIVIEEPQNISQDSSSPEPTLDSQDSLVDHEYSTGTGKTPPGGPQPMAPGVFLNQRRPSTSSQNSTTKGGDRGVSAEAKGQ